MENIQSRILFALFFFGLIFFLSNRKVEHELAGYTPSPQLTNRPCARQRRTVVHIPLASLQLTYL